QDERRKDGAPPADKRFGSAFVHDVSPRRGCCWVPASAAALRRGGSTLTETPQGWQVWKQKAAAGTPESKGYGKIKRFLPRAGKIGVFLV
ncbi:MAG TPA: hypothetical protein PLH66_05525, partial [Syntrophales bacterium]|nr:hypothetical protein [Syntrophales bacterium]